MVIIVFYRLKGAKMKKSINGQNRSGPMSQSAQKSAGEHRKGQQRGRPQSEEGFFDRSFDYRSFAFLPEGYEKAMIAFYSITLPYLAGVSFLFLFIARAKMEYFFEFSLTSFFVIWAIGYEVCAVLMMVGILLWWLKYLSTGGNEKQKSRNVNGRSRF
jgi:hypothetical protein